jgi:hypothetical protein
LFNVVSDMPMPIVAAHSIHPTNACARTMMIFLMVMTNSLYFFSLPANVFARPSEASAEAISCFARHFSSKGDCHAAKEHPVKSSGQAGGGSQRHQFMKCTIAMFFQSSI